MRLREHPGVAISGGAHLLLLAAVLVSFSRTPRFDDAQETVPVDILSADQFNQIMKGEKTAARRDASLQRVEKRADVAEHKPAAATPATNADVPAPPVQARPETDPGHDEAKAPPEPPERPAEAAAKPAPAPDPAKPDAARPEAAKTAALAPASPDAVEPKPAPRPKVEAKKDAAVAPKPKPVEPPKKPEPKFKPDDVAKLLQQDRPAEKPKEQPPAAKPRTGEETADPPRKFDLGDIGRLLTREPPQRKPSTGQHLQQEASLGSPTASAAKMSPSLWGQLDGLMQDQYRHCWNYIGMAGQEKYVPQIHVQYAQDGALIGQPELLNPPSDPNLRSLAESALRAVRRCNPLRIPALYQPYYDQWKGRIVRFDPEDML